MSSRAISVLEMREPVNITVLQPKFVQKGIWCAHLDCLVYIMPTFYCACAIITTDTSPIRGDQRGL